MGNSESRLGPADVRKCIDAVEEELASAEYAGGVTPESVVTSLGLSTLPWSREEGMWSCPKAVGVRYNKDEQIQKLGPVSVCWPGETNIIYTGI